MMMRLLVGRLAGDAAAGAAAAAAVTVVMVVERARRTLYASSALGV